MRSPEKIGNMGEGKEGGTYGKEIVKLRKRQRGRTNNRCLDKGIHYGVREKPAAMEFPRNLHGSSNNEESA